jgi:hypothetical protein
MGTPSETATTLSIVALLISLLAAVFTGWQAWSVFGSRHDARQVHLILVPNVHATVGPVRNTSRWVLENAGNGAALGPVVTIVFKRGNMGREYTARHEGAIYGRTGVQLVFDREAPSRASVIVNSDGELVADFLSATVEYGVPHSSRRRTKRLPIDRPSQRPIARPGTA